MKTYKKGISLIVLVVTIIVLAILATTVIISLSNTNIIGQASDAVADNNNAVRKEAAQLAYAAWLSDYHNGKTTKSASEYVKDYLENQNVEADDIVIGDNGEIYVGVSELPAGFQVGDYVAYQYNAASYTTPTGAGKVNTTTQTFSSAAGGNADVALWRVLSIDEDAHTVELISVMPTDTAGLVIYGQEGYLNGPTVLNAMCRALYSSELGTARSVNVQDIHNIYNYDGTKAYLDSTGATIKISSSQTGLNTVGQIMAANNVAVSTLGTVVPGGKTSVANIKYNYPHGNYNNDGYNIYVGNTYPHYTERAMLFSNTEPDFWVADTTEYLRISRNTVTYRHFYINVWHDGEWINNPNGNGGTLGSRNLCSSKGDIETDVLETPYAVRPIVELSPLVKFSDTKTTVNGQQAWTIVN